MTLIYIFTHLTKLILYSKQSFGELTPERLEFAAFKIYQTQKMQVNEDPYKLDKTDQ